MRYWRYPDPPRENQTIRNILNIASPKTTIFVQNGKNLTPKITTQSTLAAKPRVGAIKRGQRACQRTHHAPQSGQMPCGCARIGRVHDGCLQLVLVIEWMPSHSGMIRAGARWTHSIPKDPDGVSRWPDAVWMRKRGGRPRRAPPSLGMRLACEGSSSCSRPGRRGRRCPGRHARR